jgi:hypothetical protein
MRAIILSLLAGLAALSAPGEPHTWQRWEQALTSTRNYANPYSEVTLRVNYTGPAGRTLRAYGFWDGAGTWRIRCAFPAPGAWHWETECSDTNNVGLHHQRGTVQVLPYSGDSPLYQHGFLKVSENRRYLAFSDGKPFLWLGDTAWAGPHRASVEEWDHYLADRAAKRFTLIQVAPAPNWAGEADRQGQKPFPDKTLAQWNPAYWQAFERKVQRANESGLVVLLVGLMEPVSRYPESSKACLFARNIIARLFGNCVIFSPSFDSNFMPLANEVGRAAREATAVHLITQHPGTPWDQPTPTFSLQYYDESYLDIAAVQTGHNAGHLDWCARNAIDWHLQLYRHEPHKPVINVEAMYDAQGTNAWRAFDARSLGWRTWLSGAMGYTYGAGDMPPKIPQGSGAVWFWVTDAEKYDYWKKALQWESANQMRHLHDFLAGLDWWRLEPAHELIRNQPAEVTRRMVLAKTVTGDLAVAYLPDNEAIEVNMARFPGSMSARWFDPVRAQYTPVGGGITNQGTHRFVPPAKGDWVLHLTRAASAKSAAVAAPQIPALQWEERSDWINVKTDLTPPAVGDGHADDTVALQKALAGVRDGSVLYFPPGAYRITAPLSLKNANGARWIGGLVVGCGRDTRILWDGATGGTMLQLNGIAYSRFVGLEWDGRDKAGVGFHYQSTQGFQTEVTHRHLAFRGFTNAAVLENHSGEGQALAETTFENCLFESCERGVAFLQFNDYDFTFDGCEFRHCGVALDCDHGNFYVRNCHFEASRVVDIRDGSEHCSSIRRSTSTGSHAFVLRKSSVASLTIQDCSIEGWKNPDGALLLSRPPVLLFDSVFTQPPQDGRQAGLPPVRVPNEGQRLLVSGNRVDGAPGLTQGVRPMLFNIPPGQRQGMSHSAGRRFLTEKARLPKRVFDARRDFGARGNGVADDTAAIQKTIDAAAAASGQAIAYLPTGDYVISATLRIAGSNFYVGGSGWCTKLIWRGPEGGTMVEVGDPQQITLEDLMIGSHDTGPMNNGIDVHQAGSGKSSHITYDGVYVFGMYQKAPQRKGMVFTGLDENDVVLMPHVQGNLRFVNCARATVLANCSYEGSVVVEGKDKGRNGLLGFQTRLATIVSHGLYLRNNHSIVMSDFYVEQADNGYLFEGAADDPPGRATLTGAKFQSFTSNDPGKNTLLDIRGYQGQIFIGPYQFYQEPKRMRIKQRGSKAVDVLLWASSWYGAKPDPQLGPTARLLAAGNEFYGTAPDVESAVERAFFQEGPSNTTLAQLSRALDDLRRLGEADLRLNHP